MKAKKTSPEHEAGKTEEPSEENKEETQLKECTERLQRIFMEYCTVSANSNTNKMPCFKFVSLLKDSGLLKGVVKTSTVLTTTEAELYFTKVLSLLNEKGEEREIPPTASPGRREEAEQKRDKLDFKAFYYVICQVATRIYPDLPLNQAFTTLVSKDLAKAEFKAQQRSGLPGAEKDVLQSEEMIELKDYIHRIIGLYFRSYTENTIMEYDVFTKFCRDFGIFPELCNKSVLHGIFYSIAYANSNVMSGSSDLEGSRTSPGKKRPRPMPTAAKKKALRTGEYMNEEQFVDAVILCGVKSKAFEKEASSLEKVLHFMEKILQSQGIAKVKKMVGKTRISADDIDPLFEVRARYREYFDRRVKGNNYRQELLDQVFADDEEEEAPGN